MTDQELERRLRQALDAAAPDDLSGVLSRCVPRTEAVVPFRPRRRSHARALIAACLTLVLVGGTGGVFYQRANAVASVVSLDVNPSIELKVNQKEKVLSCIPLNQEAEAVLSGMGGGADLKGAKLEVAVNAVVGALVSSGYLDSLSSAIMISVEDQDQDRAARLRQELTGTVDSVLQSQSSGAAVLSQTVDASADLDQQAREYHISTGKANLVNQVIAQNDSLSFDALAKLTVEELSDLIKLGAPAIPIGMEEAARIAREGVDPALWERVKKGVYGSRVRSLNSFETLCIGQAQSFFAGSCLLRFPEVFRQIAREDVEALIARWVVPERLALSVIRPGEEAQV